jgi:hypothetical protein
MLVQCLLLHRSRRLVAAVCSKRKVYGGERSTKNKSEDKNSSIYLKQRFLIRLLVKISNWQYEQGHRSRSTNQR